jgi:hypothetical protein
MKITALITMLVLGSSTLALAEPDVRDHRSEVAPPAPEYAREHRANIGEMPWWRHPAPAPIPVPVYQPVTLASGISLQTDNRVFIKGTPGRYNKLSIKADRGRTHIAQVAIFFGNGQEQVVRNVDKTLTGNECFDIDLQGSNRQIARVVVYGGQTGGRWHRGTFDVIAS